MPRRVVAELQKCHWERSRFFSRAIRMILNAAARRAKLRRKQRRSAIAICQSGYRRFVSTGKSVQSAESCRARSEYMESPAVRRILPADHLRCFGTCEHEEYRIAINSAVRVSEFQAECKSESDTPSSY